MPKRFKKPSRLVLLPTIHEAENDFGEKEKKAAIDRRSSIFSWTVIRTRSYSASTKPEPLAMKVTQAAFSESTKTEILKSLPNAWWTPRTCTSRLPINLSANSSADCNPTIAVATTKRSRHEAIFTFSRTPSALHASAYLFAC